jgi:hypothetical protein
MGGHVAHTGQMLTEFCSEDLKRRNHSEDLGVGGKIILEWI